MKKSLIGLSLVCALTFSFTTFLDSGQAATTNGKPTLQPGVEEFIQGTYFQHAGEEPGPNETVDVLKSYLKLKGSPEELKGFQDLVKKYPDSKHAHSGLAMAYYNQYLQTKDSEDAKLALQEEIVTANLTKSYGDIASPSWIRQMAQDAHQPEVAANWFDQALAQNPDDYEVNLEYANLVKTTDKVKAEAFYLKAMDVRPVGNIDAHVAYAEFLLDNGRFQDSLNNTILVGERAFYLDFLHGYALEKLGRGNEADSYYKKFEEMSKSFPAPDRFKIPNSSHQQGITFNGAVGGGTGEYNLSYVTACESSGETVGAMREVAWSVRQRVDRGNISGCTGFNDTGSTIDDKYTNIICQANQYVSVTCGSGYVTSCTNQSSKSSTSDQIASDVYNGYVPDPFTDYCPTGSDTGFDSCSDRCTSSVSNLTSYTNTTPHSFWANQYNPPYPSCEYAAGNVCGNGGNDNYFYYSN